MVVVNSFLIPNHPVVKRVPLGVVVQLTAWNHPMLIAIKKIAPALATGNSIVLKPSELAPVTVLEVSTSDGFSAYFVLFSWGKSLMNVDYLQEFLMLFLGLVHKLVRPFVLTHTSEKWI